MHRRESLTSALVHVGRSGVAPDRQFCAHQRWLQRWPVAAPIGGSVRVCLAAGVITKSDVEHVGHAASLSNGPDQKSCYPTCRTRRRQLDRSCEPGAAGSCGTEQRPARPARHNGRMDLGLRDRVYLVTGGSRGLGFAAAQSLVADGARVLLSAPHESTAASAAARLTRDAGPGAAGWAVVDNADPTAPGRLITAARDRFG